MERIFIFALTLAMVLAMSIFDTEWQNWKAIYGKEYSSLQEEWFRRAIWEKTKKEVLEHNRLADLGIKSYWTELNHFADMTSDELMSKGCLLPPGLQEDIAEEFNNRTDVGVVESRYCIQYKKLYSLSEQQVLDCAGKGCDFGNPKDTWNYINKAGGIMKEDDYAYTGKNESCRFILSKSCMRVNITYGDLANEEDLANEVAHHGPVVIGMNMSDLFSKYNGEGVFYEEECNAEKKHVVVVVGYNTTEGGDDYWIIKNSWGTEWGNKGYAYIRRNVNLCDMKKYIFKAEISKPRIKKKQN
ncbi:cathepsin K-like [Latimeria chalumnae]|uniref:cathepsin K-like n=1 Tax=Latimeria chalumnae TaxID=7897 RepID=UPI00313F101E